MAWFLTTVGNALGYPVIVGTTDKTTRSGAVRSVAAVRSGEIAAVSASARFSVFRRRNSSDALLKLRENILPIYSPTMPI